MANRTRSKGSSPLVEDQQQAMTADHGNNKGHKAPLTFAERVVFGWFILDALTHLVRFLLAMSSDIRES